MWKTLIHSAAITLAIAALNSTAYGNPIINIAILPFLNGSVQYPYKKLSVVRHTFRIKIPEGSSAISQLTVSIPPGLTVKNDITVHDKLGKELAANTSVDENTVTIDFPQPITPVTELEIDINRVRIFGAPNVFDYRVRAKLVDVEPELDLGVAEFRTSR